MGVEIGYCIDQRMPDLAELTEKQMMRESRVLETKGTVEIQQESVAGR